jgi:hypothetical protein
MSRIKRRVIALNLPESVALLILFARHIVAALTNNPWWPSPTPPLATVTADIDALEAAEVATRTRAPGTVEARNAKQKVVEDDLIALAHGVRMIANQHPDQAAEIVASTGFDLRQGSRPPKRDIAATRGDLPGEVVLRARAVKRGAAYEWQHSNDGGQTWVTAGITTVAEIRIAGLSTGTTYAFRFRPTIRQKTGEWSQAVSFIVH